MSVANDPVRHAVLARLLFELGYIPELSKSSMFDLHRRVEEARARQTMKPANDGPGSYYQLSDERAAELSRQYPRTRPADESDEEEER